MNLQKILPALSKGIAAALLLCIASLDASGAEYFVSPHGQDSNDGLSEKHPFATVARGIRQLGPGDTLTLLPGVYRGAVSARLSGTPEAPIVIRAQRPGTALLRGDVDLHGFKRVPGHPYIYGTAFQQRVEGVAERSGRRIYLPKLSIAEVDLSLDSFYQDEDAGLLYVHTSDSGSPDGLGLTASVTDASGLLLEPPTGSKTVHDVTIEGLSFTGFQSREFPEVQGRNRWGLDIRSPERVTVRQCSSFLNGGGILLLAGRESVVEDCRAFGNYSRFLDLGNNILGWSVDHVTFRRNVIEGFDQGTVSNPQMAFYTLPGECVMEDNLAINSGYMIKGMGSGLDAEIQRQKQNRNSAIGNAANYYLRQNDTNLLLKNYLAPAACKKYADPRNHDFRLQSETGENARVFYVSASGDDGASGSSLEKAWRTLAHAASHVLPGQTVYITAGEYGEALAPRRSGRADAPIQFVRYGHDRVVLDGRGEMPVGVDLTGKSNIQVRGMVIRNFVKTGILAKEGSNIRLEENIVTGGRQALSADRVSALLLKNNLLRNHARAALSLRRCSQATLMGNILGSGKGTAIRCDDATLRTLWSDCNDFPPGTPSIAQVGERMASGLDEWRRLSALDGQSISAKPEYRDAGQGDYSLPARSVLVGRGPDAGMIGPYRRVETSNPVAIENILVHSVTATTANLEWWTPAREVKTTLGWGATPDCQNRLALPPSLFHTASVADLKPDQTYYFRVTTTDTAPGYCWAPYGDPAAKSALATSAKKVSQFKTPAEIGMPRTFHVSLAGNDANTGLSAEKAWRTIGYAAEKAVAGDTVLIHGGDYREYVMIRATGDRNAPITFQAATGEEVWIDGANRKRDNAIEITSKHHIHLDGLHFRNFNRNATSDGVIKIVSGSDHIISRCFFDGRIFSGYTTCAVDGAYTANLLMENCVMIGGMQEAVTLSHAPNATIRHCVFYNNNLRAITILQWNRDDLFTLSHNLICDSIPGKTKNALIRVMDLENLRSDHNGYFVRTEPGERAIVETMNIGGQFVGVRKPATILGESLKMDALRSATGQEQSSIFGNPNFAVVDHLQPSDVRPSEWRKMELRWDQKTNAFLPMGFKDFFVDAKGAFAKTVDGKPIGLDRAAFGTADFH